MFVTKSNQIIQNPMDELKKELESLDESGRTLAIYNAQRDSDFYLEFLSKLTGNASIKRFQVLDPNDSSPIQIIDIKKFLSVTILDSRGSYEYHRARQRFFEQKPHMARSLMLKSLSDEIAASKLYVEAVKLSPEKRERVVNTRLSLYTKHELVRGRCAQAQKFAEEITTVGFEDKRPTNATQPTISSTRH